MHVEVCSFLGHVCFYRGFIKDFIMIALPLSNLLQKDVAFIFNDKCLELFDQLKKALTTTLAILDLALPFELIYDASNNAVRAILAQKVGKVP